MLEFLKSFESRPDHPMATPAQARAILAALAGEKPEAALDQLAHWAGSLRDSDGFACDQRLAVVHEIEAAARPVMEAAFGQFLARIHARDRAQKKRFELLYAVWHRLAGAYARCIGDHEHGEKGAARMRDSLPLAVVRSLRLAAQAERMRCVRYLGVDPAAWEKLCHLVAYCEIRGIDASPVVAWEREIHTTPRTEFLRILGMSLAALHELPPEQVELAYRILGRFSASFAWSREPSAECNFVIDLSAKTPPHHLHQAEPPAASKRHFGGGPALAKLGEVARLSEADLLSEEMRFGREFTPAQIVSVMHHLVTYLGTSPPRRHFARAAVDREVSVVHGFGAICQRVTALEPGSAISAGDDTAARDRTAAPVQLAAEEIESVPEAWRERDRSEWGLGADVPSGGGAWAEPGVACALRESAGAPWQVAIVRRLVSDDAGRLHCGFWILSKKPISVWLRVLGSEGQEASNWETSTGSFSYRYLRAILLPDALKSHQHPVMLIECGTLAIGELCEVMVGEHSRTIELVELIEQGIDYMRVAFVWRAAAKT